MNNKLTVSFVSERMLAASVTVPFERKECLQFFGVVKKKKEKISTK